MKLPNIESISRNEIDLIELIYDVIEKGEYRNDGSKTIFRATISPNEHFYEVILKNENEKELSNPLIIEAQEPILKIMERN